MIHMEVEGEVSSSHFVLDVLVSPSVNSFFFLFFTRHVSLLSVCLMALPFPSLSLWLTSVNSHSHFFQRRSTLVYWTPEYCD
jgi:hypothetical protein